MKKLFFGIPFVLLILVSCNKKEEPIGPQLIFKFRFDSTQVRLNNFGQPSTIPNGNAAQSPKFNLMSAHYIELAYDSLLPLGSGQILYKAAETKQGGENAIDFSKSMLTVDENIPFYSIPIKNLTPGIYKWLRVSLSYHNFVVNTKFVNNQYPWLSGSVDVTISSFLGFNTYITDFYITREKVIVNGNKKQGFWACEYGHPNPLNPNGGFIYGSITGQAPAGATTVPNPLFASSPVPQGSCVVTGRFANNLTITGNETKDIVVIVSLSTNKSFEWKDKNGDGLFQPAKAEDYRIIEDSVVNMGIRGLIPIIE